MRRRRKRLILAASILLFFLVLPVTVLYVGFGRLDIGPASRDLDRAEVEYRSLDWPWVAREIQPSPPLQRDNAAPYIDEAGRLLKQSYLKQRQSSLFWSAMRHGKWEVVKAILPQYRDELALAVRAAQKPRLYYPHDLDNSLGLSFPEMGLVRRLQDLVCAQAVTDASNGNVDGAVTNLRLSWKLSSLIGQEPVMIAVLVQTSGQAETLDAYQRCAALLSANREALHRLLASILGEMPHPDLKGALQWEAYSGIAVCRNLDYLGGLKFVIQVSRDHAISELPPSPPASKIRRDGLPPDLFARAFLDGQLRFWTKAARYIDAHPNNPYAWGTYIDAEQVRSQPPPSLSDTFARAWAPMCGFVGQEVAELEAHYATTKVLIDALIVRSETGKMPQRIQDIPGKWIDPFNGKPLHVQTTATTIRVYSVGIDGNDDGGVSRYEGRSVANPRAQYDIVAAFPPLPPTGL